MKDPKGHGSNGRGGPYKPIPNHPFHRKSNAELHYIIKDASEAERATRGMSAYNPNSGKREDTSGKYSDQVNDAASVIGYRDRGGKQDTEASLALHSGNPKSDPVPTHEAMQWGMDGAPVSYSTADFPKAAPPNRHGYSPDAVNKAIASSNRSGRRIGGKEASAIHRLLKGR